MSRLRTQLTVAGCLMGFLTTSCATFDEMLRPERAAETGRVAAEITRASDGWVALSSYYTNANGDRIQWATAKKRDWVVESGKVAIQEDPETGMTLFRAEGLEPAVVRVKRDGKLSPPITIGIDPSVVPPDEEHFLFAGGGACAENPNHGGLFAFTVDVRAIIDARVIPLSLAARELVYNTNGEYYAYHPDVGTMRLTYNPDYKSGTVLRSLNPPTDASGPFFPAAATTTLYLIIDFLDLGMKVYNKDPMVLASERTSWPPFEIPQVSKQPTKFYSVSDPDKLMFTIEKQESYIYPANELGVKIKNLKVSEDGILTAEAMLTNPSDHAAQVRWFVLGSQHEARGPARGKRYIQAGASSKVYFEARVPKSKLRQFVTFAAVTETGRRMTGFASRDFDFGTERLH